MTLIMGGLLPEGWHFMLTRKQQRRANRQARKRAKEARKLCNKPDLGRWHGLYEPSERFFNSTAWVVIRKRVLDFYGRQCMRCRTTDDVIQVDHIKSRSQFPELALDFNNLQVLCKPCNDLKGDNDWIDYRPTGE